MKPKIIPRPPKLDNSRSQFEKWVKEVLYNVDLKWSSEDIRDYQSLDTDWLWKAWSAGRKSF